MNEKKPPNVVLILSDQLRADCLGVAGNAEIDTPNLDDLASRGTWFGSAYSAVPSCVPARSTIMTGLNQWHTGVLGMGRGQGPMPDDFPHTLAGEFTRGGYRTHLVGKGHFHPYGSTMGFQSMELDEAGRALQVGHVDDYRAWFAEMAPPGVTPDDHGVDCNSWVARPWHTAEHLHPTAWTVARSLQFLKERDAAQPFFLNVSFDRPHSPFCPPQCYWDRYIDASLPEAAVGDWAAGNDRPEDAVSVNAWRGRMTARQIHRARAGYYGDVSFLDSQVGVLVNWMRRYQPEAYQNTWFLFASDHGEMLGDHHLWRKTYAYEGSARIPFFVVPPASADKPARRRVEEVVELRDILPSLLEAAGLPVPAGVDGRSVLGLMEAPQADWREYLHGEHSLCYHRDQEMQYVTDGRRKFIWLPRLGVEQFFDLESDPQELVNRIDDSSRGSEVELWRGRLVHELEQRDCGWVADGKLCCPGDAPMVSPYRDKRWSGSE